MELIEVNEEFADLIRSNPDLVQEHLSSWIKRQKKIGGDLEGSIISNLSNIRQTFGRTRKLALTFGRKQLIRDLILQGYEFDDFYKVHSYMLAQWWGTDMQKYCNPETLYRPSNFPRYLEKASDPKFKAMDSIIAKQEETNRGALALVND